MHLYLHSVLFAPNTTFYSPLLRVSLHLLDGLLFKNNAIKKRSFMDIYLTQSSKHLKINHKETKFTTVRFLLMRLARFFFCSNEIVQI